MLARKIVQCTIMMRAAHKGHRWSDHVRSSIENLSLVSKACCEILIQDYAKYLLMTLVQFFFLYCV